MAESPPLPLCSLPPSFVLWFCCGVFCRCENGLRIFVRCQTELAVASKHGSQNRRAYLISCKYHICVRTKQTRVCHDFLLEHFIFSKNISLYSLKVFFSSHHYSYYSNSYSSGPPCLSKQKSLLPQAKASFPPKKDTLCNNTRCLCV